MAQIGWSNESKLLDKVIKELNSLKRLTGSSSSSEQPIKTVEVTITRPSNTTPYTGGDVIMGTLSPSLDMARVALGGIDIIKVVAVTNDTGLAGKNIRIHWNKDEMSSSPTDNTPFTKDTTVYAGYTNLVFGSGTVADIAVPTDGYVAFAINPVTTLVYPVIEAVDAFTPSSASTWIKLIVSYIQTN